MIKYLFILGLMVLFGWLLNNLIYDIRRKRRARKEKKYQDKVIGVPKPLDVKAYQRKARKDRKEAMDRWAKEKLQRKETNLYRELILLLNPLCPDCSGKLIVLKTTIGDPEAIRHDKECEHCGQRYGVTKAHMYKL